MAALERTRRTIERVALVDQVHEVLKGRILDRDYQPGERLGVDGLARELGVSSTPIREALGRLTAEGLVVAESFVGFAVAAMPSPSYFVDLYRFRAVIEPWAAAETARLRPPAVLAEIEAAMAVMSSQALDRTYSRFRSFSGADEAFHDTIMGGTGNLPALRAFRHLRVHLHTSRLYAQHPQDTDLARAEHAAIVDAIRSGDAEAAAHAMEYHLAASRRRLLG